MKKLILFFIIILLQTNSFAQTLEKKWNFMLKKSNSYKAHKVIKEEDIAGMWEVIQDSISMLKIKLKQEQEKVKNQNIEIEKLKANVNDITNNLNKVTGEKSSIIASGAKTGQYINALWIALGIIALICVVLFILFQRSNGISEQKKKDYELLSKSFEEYKTTKIEVERKLKREIQTYVNKIEELKN